MILRTSGIGVSIAFLREAQWGSRGREFDSRHSDHKSNDFTLEIVGFFIFVYFNTLKKVWGTIQRNAPNKSGIQFFDIATLLI